MVGDIIERYQGSGGTAKSYMGLLTLLEEGNGLKLVRLIL